MLGLRAPQIRRAGALSTAANNIADAAGPEGKNKLLARGGPLKRSAILELSQLEPKAIKILITRWELSGKFPRDWRNGGGNKTITLPREPLAVATALTRRLGVEEVGVIADFLIAFLTSRKKESQRNCSATVYVREQP
jgi:hypothetical protein